jgi:hypothetical protein
MDFKDSTGSIRRQGIKTENKSLLFKNITTRRCEKKGIPEKRSGKFLPAFATEFRTRPVRVSTKWACC